MLVQVAIINFFFFFGCHVNNIKMLGTQYQKIWDQIDKFKMLGTKYVVYHLI